MPSGEKSSKARMAEPPGHFLRSGLKTRIAKLRRIRAIFRGVQPYFSATQTVWRSEQDSNPRYSLEARSTAVSVTCIGSSACRENAGPFGLVSSLSSPVFTAAERAKRRRLLAPQVPNLDAPHWASMVRSDWLPSMQSEGENFSG